MNRLQKGLPKFQEEIQKKARDARAELEKAVAVMPADPVVLQHLGDAYRALKLYGKAREVYDRALEVSPEDSVLRAKRDALPGGGK